MWYQQIGGGEVVRKGRRRGEGKGGGGLQGKENIESVKWKLCLRFIYARK